MLLETPTEARTTTGCFEDFGRRLFLFLWTHIFNMIQNHVRCHHEPVQVCSGDQNGGRVHRRMWSNLGTHICSGLSSYVVFFSLFVKSVFCLILKALLLVCSSLPVSVIGCTSPHVLHPCSIAPAFAVCVSLCAALCPRRIVV